jgi:hypothetical protein
LGGVRALCFYLHYCMRTHKTIVNAGNESLAPTFVKCVTSHNSSPELKELAIQCIIFLTCTSSATASLPRVDQEELLLKSFVAMLVSGARERSPSIRFSSEVGLVKLLELNATTKSSPLFEVFIPSSFLLYLIYYEKCLFFSK